MRSNNSVINVYKKNNIKSEVVTQLLYGDTFKILKKSRKWLKIRNYADNYKGYIINKHFSLDQKNTHKICNLSSTLYSQPHQKYKIKKKNIIGHSDIAPLRKIDPGEKFPWKEMADKKIGIWHNYKKGFLKKFRKVNILKRDKKKFNQYLVRIGYCTKSFKGKKVVKAFQRHFRKELINGLLDKECLIISQNLSKNL